MGNCLVLWAHNRVSCFAAIETSKDRNTVQLLKSDGDSFEFSTPVLVKDALRKFSGFNVALAKKNPLYLPPDFLLKLGYRYHLIPSVERFESVEESRVVDKEDSGGVKRIKVVITKKQLQDLLSKEVLAVDIFPSFRVKHMVMTTTTMMIQVREFGSQSWNRYQKNTKPVAFSSVYTRLRGDSLCSVVL